MEILIIVLLILLNGIFSMSEIALVSSRKFKLQSAAKRGNKNAGKALELADNPNKFLSTVQLGITLIGILTGVYSGEKLTADFVTFLNKFSFLAPYSETLAVVLIVIVITYFSIVFGELLPKRIGLTFPEAIASSVARPMDFLSTLTRPFIALLARTNDLFLKIFGIKAKNDGTVSEEEIKAIIAESTSVGEIQEIEQEIVKRVFVLGDRKAGELMTHRSDLICIDVNDDFETIRRKVDSHPHSVYPIINKTPDELVGLVSINQIFTKSTATAGVNIKQLMVKPTFVQENMPAYKVLEKFKELKTRLIIVVDEYGSIEGVLSISDIVNALIGEVNIPVEESFNIIKRDDQSWLADGQYPYYEFVNFFEMNDAEEPVGFTTLAGLILKNINHYPVAGEKIRWKGFELEIVDMDERKIDKILITKLS